MADPAHQNERTPLLAHQKCPSSLLRSLNVASSSVSNSSLGDRAASTTNDQTCLVSAPCKTVEDEETNQVLETSTPIGRIILVLLIGGFISNADGSLLLATHPIIASEFNALQDSSWLVTSFALAMAATQPLYGKLSDIYGRKSLLLLAYTLFGFGWYVLLHSFPTLNDLIPGQPSSRRRNIDVASHSWKSHLWSRRFRDDNPRLHPHY
jgi:hypothetical protein